MSVALAFAGPPSRTYCPACNKQRPTSDFLTTTEPDPAGAFRRCVSCITAECEARAFIRAHRREVLADPSSAVAPAYRAARLVAAHNARAIHAGRITASVAA